MTEFETGLEFHKSGDLVSAEHHYNQAWATDRTCVDSMLGLCTIATLNGHNEDAMFFANKILVEETDNQHALAAKSSLLRLEGRNDEAFEILEYVYGITDEEAVAQTYADELITRERYPEALVVLEKLPESASVMCRIADVSVHLSNLERAKTIYKQLMKDNPFAPQPHTALAPLMKHGDNDIISVAKLERMLDMLSIPKSSHMGLHAALGRILEDKGEYNRSFGHYADANKIKADEIDTNTDRSALSKKIMEYYTKDRFKSVEMPDDECPLVFVFGMPRSGTTLTESILVSHPDIDTMGETRNVVDEVISLANGNVFNSASESTAAYVKNRIHNPNNAKFVVDKMPHNFQYIGLMYQLFPNAKFIYCKRDALDNCFSCFATMFAKGHNYSYDQKTLGEEYNAHLEMMSHWESVLPSGTILQVDYEDTVSAQREVTERILDFVGVDFNEQCMNFHELKRDVKTASLAQVINPIYTTSVSRAQNFKEHLGTLIETLRYGETYDD